jgi:hypothetical protein
LKSIKERPVRYRPFAEVAQLDIVRMDVICGCTEVHPQMAIRITA